MDPTSDLDRMERKIRSSEAHAAALTEMGDESYETQFRELEMDDDIEAQLQALKGGTAPESLAGALSSGSAEGDEFADAAATATTAESGGARSDSSASQ